MADPVKASPVRLRKAVSALILCGVQVVMGGCDAESERQRVREELRDVPPEFDHRDLARTAPSGSPCGRMSWQRRGCE